MGQTGFESVHPVCIAFATGGPIQDQRGDCLSTGEANDCVLSNGTLLSNVCVSRVLDCEIVEDDAGDECERFKLDEDGLCPFIEDELSTVF